MKRITFSATVVTLLFAATAAAQDAPTIIMGRYTRCSQGQSARADEIARSVLGPAAQKHVEAGHFESWGWLAHASGGNWRRLFVLRGTDLDVMMDASQQLNQEVAAEYPDETAEMGTICPSHDDYIWTGVANSPPNPDPAAGPASLSAYYVCDIAREGRANEIFEQLMAPLYRKHTEMGHIAGWGFFAHRFGGQYRRLETFSGVDHKTLLNMQNDIYEEAIATDALAFNEFRQICNAHTDYMWRDARTQ